MSQCSSLSSTTNMIAIIHLSSTVVCFPALWPERSTGVAASAYQVPIDHVDGERLEALSPPVGGDSAQGMLHAPLVGAGLGQRDVGIGICSHGRSLAVIA